MERKYIEKAQEKLNEYIEQTERSLEITAQLEPVLKKFHGKTINKRIQTAVAKAMPDWTIYYNIRGSMYYLDIWGNGLSMNKRFSILLGYQPYNNDPTPLLNFYDVWGKKHNGWLPLEKGRLAKYKKAISKMTGWVERYNEAIDTLDVIRGEMDKLEVQYTLFGS